MEESPVAVCVFVFLSVVAPYLALSFAADAPPVAGGSGTAALPVFFRLSWRFVRALADGLGASFAAHHPKQAGRYGKLVLLSGWNLTAEQVFAGQVFAACAGALFAGVGTFVLSGRAGSAAGFGAAGAALGWVYPKMIIDRRARERQTEIVKALPFAIDLLASAMRAGLDFVAAVRYYVKIGGKGALTVEFGLLLRQMELGKSRLEALEEMATHVQTAEFTAFVGAVAHGTEIGASIIDTLQIQGDDMRRARFNLAERKAARAPSIMIFPIALFILPAVFTIIFVPVYLRFKAAKGG